jgi:short-chain fatty acids transporter
LSFSEKYTKAFKYLLPTPFTIAVVLTLVTFFTVLFTTKPIHTGFAAYSFDVLHFWEQGFWDNDLLVFAVQMMLMLVLGHILALTKPFNSLILMVVKHCTTTAKAAFLVTLLTILVSLFNWGLGLIFGAIFARKVGEYAQKQQFSINYPLIGAAGYSGLMVWHGGLSGSSLAKVAEGNHIKDMMAGIFNEAQLAALPEKISYAETVWSPMNIVVMLMVIVILPLAMFWLGKRTASATFTLTTSHNNEAETVDFTTLEGAEKLDYSRMFSLLFGGAILCYLAVKIVTVHHFNVLDFFTPNNINMLLLALGITLHKNFTEFLTALDEAIVGAAGILIQFPLYFGIMGMMKNSGLIADIADFFVSISNTVTYPIYTFFSAGLINVFVPSGGGQWAVQGPIIVQAAQDIGVSLPKSILALAYGDQLTNMLQPFWALPLLGITGLKAKEILPYTLFLMLVGLIIFVSCLLIF